MILPGFTRIATALASLLESLRFFVTLLGKKRCKKPGTKVDVLACVLALLAIASILGLFFSAARQLLQWIW